MRRSLHARSKKYLLFTATTVAAAITAAAHELTIPATERRADARANETASRAHGVVNLDGM
jgi:hypothetical protein